MLKNKQNLPLCVMIATLTLTPKNRVAGAEFPWVGPAVLLAKFCVLGLLERVHSNRRGLAAQNSTRMQLQLQWQKNALLPESIASFRELLEAVSAKDFLLQQVLFPLGGFPMVTVFAPCMCAYMCRNT